MFTLIVLGFPHSLIGIIISLIGLDVMNRRTKINNTNKNKLMAVDDELYKLREFAKDYNIPSHIVTRFAYRLRKAVTAAYIKHNVVPVFKISDDRPAISIVDDMGIVNGHISSPKMNRLKNELRPLIREFNTFIIGHTDMTLIEKLNKTPDRQVFTIPIGNMNMPPSEITEILERYGLTGVN